MPVPEAGAPNSVSSSRLKGEASAWTASGTRSIDGVTSPKDTETFKHPYTYLRCTSSVPGMQEDTGVQQ